MFSIHKFHVMSESSQRQPESYVHTPDVVAHASAAAHILVAQETHEVDVVAGVLAGLAIDAGSAGEAGLVAVEVEGALVLVLLVLEDLSVLQLLHGDGVGGGRGAERLGAEQGRVGSPFHLLDDARDGQGRAGEGREDDGGDTGLHDGQLRSEVGRLLG